MNVFSNWFVFVRVAWNQGYVSRSVLNRVGHVGLVGHSGGSFSWVKLVGHSRGSF